MTKPYGRWHYEYVPGAPEGKRWRIGDADDDNVGNYATEGEAKLIVRNHNAKVDDSIPDAWRF
jgi:hypothetical protein